METQITWCERVKRKREKWNSFFLAAEGSSAYPENLRATWRSAAKPRGSCFFLLTKICFLVFRTPILFKNINKMFELNVPKSWNSCLFIYESKFENTMQIQCQIYLAIIYCYEATIIAWWKTFHSLPLPKNKTYILLKIFQQWYCWVSIKTKSFDILYRIELISYIILYQFIAL